VQEGDSSDMDRNVDVLWEGCGGSCQMEGCVAGSGLGVVAFLLSFHGSRA
jgi:hypothetical protein